MPDGYMDAEEDTLRAEMARIACEALDWRWLFERTRTGHTLVPSPTEAIMPAIDALLPLIREYVTGAVHGERERADAWRELADGRSELLACYRMGTRPSEKLHRRLDAARIAVDGMEGRTP